MESINEVVRVRQRRVNDLIAQVWTLKAELQAAERALWTADRHLADAEAEKELAQQAADLDHADALATDQAHADALAKCIGAPVNVVSA